MRVLYLSTWYPYPPDNGSRIRAYHMLRALAGRHQVTLVAFDPGRSPAGRPPQPADGVRIHAVAADPFRYVSLPTAIKFASPMPVACWPSRAMHRTLDGVLDGSRWDAVVAFQSPAARYARRLPGVPRLLDVDTAYTYQARERYAQASGPAARLQAWASWKKTQRCEARLFREFRVCTVVSPLEVDFVQAMVSGASTGVRVLSNGVDCAYHRPGLAPCAPERLVFNGSLTYSANYDAMRYFLAEIYPLIRQQAPGVSLCITGSTAGVDLAGLRLDPSVQLTGFVDDVRPVVGGAGVCPVPLRQGGGTRVKILEAMALGTPVVCTAKAAEGLPAVPGQDIVIADNPAGFAAEVVRLMRDPAWHGQLAANARRLVESRFDWAQIGREFVGLVEEVAGGRPGRAGA